MRAVHLGLLALSALPVALACSSHDSNRPGADAGDAACFPGVDGAVVDPPIHTPRWAFEPWLSKDYSSADDTRGFVQGAIDRGIPVGVAVIDSPWESNYNTFVPDETPGRYPGFASMVSDLAAKNVKTVVWLTQFANDRSIDIETGADTHYAGESSVYTFGLSCNFFIDQGQTYGWYKGTGASVDFMNPSALAWWHSLQDPLLAMGVAGYKLDFGDSYVPTDPVTTAAGPVSHQQYSEAYYRDMRAYATQKVGSEFVTMVRGWDASYQFEPRTYARQEDAPVVWDGDNRRDWVGVADAMNTTLMNASLGYVVIGSDIGGYLDHDDQAELTAQLPFDTLVFDRWVAMGALSPLMQLHSRADVMPWTVPDHADETVVLYKYWATIHHALVPFFYSLAEDAYADQRGGIVRPLGDASSWAGDFRYMLGEAMLVAPVLDATGKRDVPLPNDASYYDWWTPAGDAIAGGTTVKADVSADRAKYPLYVREGAIVPMNVDSDVLALGTAASAGAWTILTWPSRAVSTFVLHEDDDTTTPIEASASSATPGLLTVKLSRAAKPLLVRVHAPTAASAKVNGVAATSVASFAALAASSGAAWFAETSTRSAWVRVPVTTDPIEIDVMAP